MKEAYNLAMSTKAPLTIQHKSKEMLKKAASVDSEIGQNLQRLVYGKLTMIICKRK